MWITALRQAGWVALAVVMMAAPAPLGAQGSGGAAPLNSAVDALFEALATAPSRARAEVIASDIMRVWRTSGSPTVDLLFEQAEDMMSQGAPRVARAKLTGIVQIRPDLGEAWAARAAANWTMGEHDAALSDLEAALDIEPRHFGAWVLLAQIREVEGEIDRALRAYRRAAALHPFLPGVAEKIRGLTARVRALGAQGADPWGTRPVLDGRRLGD